MIRRQTTGFTLLELIFATATAAVLALSLYTSLNVAMTARRAAHDAVVLDRQAALLADLIVRDLEATLPPTGILAGPFLGDTGGGLGGTRLSFHAFSPGAGDGSSDLPHRIELELRTDISPGMLVRRVQPNLLAATEEELPEEILCRDVTTFAVRYYDGAAWHDTWDSTLATSTMQNTLPRAVELTLVLDRSTGDEAQAQRAMVRRLVSMPVGSDIAEIADGEEAQP